MKSTIQTGTCSHGPGGGKAEGVGSSAPGLSDLEDQVNLGQSTLVNWAILSIQHISLFHSFHMK